MLDFGYKRITTKTKLKVKMVNISCLTSVAVAKLAKTAFLHGLTV